MTWSKVIKFSYILHHHYFGEEGEEGEQSSSTLVFKLARRESLGLKIGDKLSLPSIEYGCLLFALLMFHNHNDREVNTNINAVVEMIFIFIDSFF